MVRAFQVHEWRTLRDMRLRALADAPEAFARTFAEEAPRPDSEWAQQLADSVHSLSKLSLVAERNGVAVGLAYAQLRSESPDTADLFSMWVAPEARRNGAGRALLAAVIAWAGERGVRRLILQVAEGNTNAESLYAEAGLHFTGECAPLRPGLAQKVRTMVRSLERN